VDISYRLARDRSDQLESVMTLSNPETSK